MRDTGKSKTERARELRKGIDEYFDERTARGRFPTEAGMLLALGLSEERYAALRRERIFAREFERARLARMDWLENQMVTEGGKASGCMNALKQEKNGGYADRAAAGSREQKLVIELKGVGSGAAL
ncbi:MAG: hypothetical protein ACLUGW_10255 [Oscillospiraceae bacterium]